MKIAYLSLVTGAFVLSCQNTPHKSSDTTADISAPVETKAPNTEFKPAFPGHTRITGMKTQTPIKTEILTDQLGKPWGITNLPDGRFLITEKSGYMMIVSTDGKIIKKVTGLPEVDAQGQGGLLDVILDPDFATNRTLYFSFSEPTNGGNHTAAGKGQLSADETRLENSTVIFRATPTYDGKLHYGSRLVFDKEGYLFVSTGERSDKQTRALAQKTDNYLGKILKITKDGKPAPGNPFINKTGFQPEIYSYGHRNPQGLAMDEKDQLWETEMGPKGGDEINLIQSGKNYGWGDVTYGEEYSGEKVGAGIAVKAGTEQPVYYWDPSVSPSGITFYKGNIAEWNGNLLIGCLGSEHIVRIAFKNNKVSGEERLLEDLGERFRDLLNGSDGNLYAVTDSGKLIKISPK